MASWKAAPVPEQQAESAGQGARLNFDFADGIESISMFGIAIPTAGVVLAAVMIGMFMLFMISQSRANRRRKPVRQVSEPQ